MDFFALIKTFIFLLSSVVLYPTLLLLAGLSIYMFFDFGRFSSEWIGRLRRRRRAGAAAKDAQLPVKRYLIRLEALRAEHPDAGRRELEITYLLQDCAARLHAGLDHHKIMIRLGPALGLLGTLVPMGTALAGLSQGDIAAMTSDLVVAFTTTVVGLSLGSLSYFVYIVKQRWLDEDLRNIEYLTELAEQ